MESMRCKAGKRRIPEGVLRHLCELNKMTPLARDMSSTALCIPSHIALSQELLPLNMEVGEPAEALRDRLSVHR